MWMAPALQAIFVIAMVCQYSRVSGLICVAFATGPDEFREQGSYRLNDLGGRDIGRRFPYSLVDFVSHHQSNVLHLAAGSSVRCRYSSCFVSSAQMIRADLLAIATVASLKGFSSSSLAVHISAFSGLFFAMSARDVIPMINSFRM